MLKTIDFTSFYYQTFFEICNLQEILFFHLGISLNFFNLQMIYHILHAKQKGIDYFYVICNKNICGYFQNYKTL